MNNAIIRNTRARAARRYKTLRPLLLALALTLPSAQTAQAVEIYYARAIGHEFLPEPTRTPPPPATAPDAKPAQDLPGLGSQPEEKAAPSAGTSTWSKILIGVVVVGAIAALANKGGGGGGEVSVNTSGGSTPDTGGTGGSGSTPGGSGGSTPSAPQPPPPPTGGGTGGGGINIGVGGAGPLLDDKTKK